ncbi:hypothetical protein TIFTF001_028253 [Ficus carica]|uniref:Uncharacterized protein n=1 Tax=Ficus carica TaxID=3494 RepID=A0AA88DPP8_FICCA|nr:hypothetical protein TIFTF001_028253 [Ficus carica]
MKNSESGGRASRRKTTAMKDEFGWGSREFEDTTLRDLREIEGGFESGSKPEPVNEKTINDDSYASNDKNSKRDSKYDNY